MESDSEMSGADADVVEAESIDSGPRRIGSRLDLVIGIVFVGLGVFLFFGVWSLPEFGPTAPGAGFLPRIIAVLFVILGAALAIKQFGRKARAKGRPEGEIGRFNWRVLPVFALLVVVAFIYVPAGFLISAFVIMAALVFGLERKFTLAAILTVVLVPVAFWELFYHLLGVPLPTGILYF